jgi:murein DD-endopeptidase MepM/ murein hydrolase activator NlpD
MKTRMLTRLFPLSLGCIALVATAAAQEPQYLEHIEPTWGTPTQNCHSDFFTGGDHAIDVASQVGRGFQCHECNGTYGANGGYPIYASEEGTVAVVSSESSCCTDWQSNCSDGVGPGNGRVIKLSHPPTPAHPEGGFTTYAHLSVISVASNQYVYKGTLLGYEGCTGMTDSGGAEGGRYFRHLHFATSWSTATCSAGCYPAYASNWMAGRRLCGQ